MIEFLAEDNLCGQTLLNIVAVGNAIVAEILRIKDYIPELFRYKSVHQYYVLVTSVSCDAIPCFYSNLNLYFVYKLNRLEKKQDQIKYGDIIMDFRYFKISEAQEKRIEENAELHELDEEIRENYLEILSRCFLAFESIHQYVSDLKFFIQEVNDGMYIQQSIETILQDVEGKQLIVIIIDLLIDI